MKTVFSLDLYQQRNTCVKKTNSKPVRFEFERKNKGAKYSFRRQAETERCELVLMWKR